MNFKTSFDNVVTIFKSKDGKRITSAVGTLIGILLYLLIIKVPFILARELTLDFITKKIGPNILVTILYWAFEILYYLLFLFIGQKMFTKAFNPKKTE